MKNWYSFMLKVAESFEERLDRLQEEDKTWYQKMFDEPATAPEEPHYEYEVEEQEPEPKPLPNYNRRFDPVSYQKLAPIPKPDVSKKIPFQASQTTKIMPVEQPKIVAPVKNKPTPEPKKDISTPEKITHSFPFKRRDVDKNQYKNIMENFSKTLESQVNDSPNLSQAVKKHLKFLAQHVQTASKKQNADTYAIVSGLNDYRYLSNKIPIILDIISFLG